MTLSPGLSLIPRTPRAVLPMARTSDSLNRITFPPLPNNITSLEPSVTEAPTNVLPSSSSIAIRPVLRCLENSIREVFFTVPFEVAMNMNWSSRYSCTGNMAVIRSSACRGRILITGLPRAVLLAGGIWNTRNQ